MRGLLPGSSKKSEGERLLLTEIAAPLFVPNPSPEELHQLHLLELGNVHPPVIYIDQEYRLILVEVPGVHREENFRNWKLVKLVPFSFVEARKVVLSDPLRRGNAIAHNNMDRAYRAATQEREVGEDLPEEEDYPEEDEDAYVPTPLGGGQMATTQRTFPLPNLPTDETTF
jgi:hypothetical protein